MPNPQTTTAAAQSETEQRNNDDVFAYEGGGGMTQCISGFGRNAIKDIGEDLDAYTPGGEEHIAARDRLTWHIEELVRWCRHFNGKSQELEQQLAALRAKCDALQQIVRRYRDFKPCFKCHSDEMCEDCAEAYSAIHTDATTLLTRSESQ